MRAAGTTPIDELIGRTSAGSAGDATVIMVTPQATEMLLDSVHRLKAYGASVVVVLLDATSFGGTLDPSFMCLRSRLSRRAGLHGADKGDNLARAPGQPGLRSGTHGSYEVAWSWTIGTPIGRMNASPAWRPLRTRADPSSATASTARRSPPARPWAWVQRWTGFPIRHGAAGVAAHLPGMGIAVYSVQQAKWINPQPALVLILFFGMLVGPGAGQDPPAGPAGGSASGWGWGYW